MTRVLVLLGLGLWVGATLVLAEVRWFSRMSLVERLRPYSPGGMGRSETSGVLSVANVGDAVGPLASAVGERLARLLGVGEDVEVRLRRIHAPLDPVGFRVRQVGWSVVAFGAGAVMTVGLGLPGPVGALVVLGAPALAFLIEEQVLATRSARWQRRLFLELPVVAEQIALLLAAGWSLTAALHRLAARGTGAVAADLTRVCDRLRQGLS
ncbi:hypothetical protein BH18ACT1_BH18ACT1_17890 [soil metagenome]